MNATLQPSRSSSNRSGGPVSPPPPPTDVPVGGGGGGGRRNTSSTRTSSSRGGVPPSSPTSSSSPSSRQKSSSTSGASRGPSSSSSKSNSTASVSSSTSSTRSPTNGPRKSSSARRRRRSSNQSSSSGSPKTPGLSSTSTTTTTTTDAFSSPSSTSSTTGGNSSGSSSSTSSPSSSSLQHLHFGPPVSKGPPAPPPPAAVFVPRLHLFSSLSAATSRPHSLASATHTTVIRPRNALPQRPTSPLGADAPPSPRSPRRGTLHGAAWDGDITAIAAAMKSAAGPIKALTAPDTSDATEKGYTPMHIIALRGHLDILTYIINVLPAGPHRSQVLNVRDGTGAAPLHRAASQGQLAIVRALLAAGADAAPRDKRGRTPAMIASSAPLQSLLRRTQRDAVDAAASGDRESLETALANGFLPSWTDIRGNTILHAAVAGGHISLALWILRENIGVPVAARNHKGLTARDIAVSTAAAMTSSKPDGSPTTTPANDLPPPPLPSDPGPVIINGVAVSSSSSSSPTPPPVSSSSSKDPVLSTPPSPPSPPSAAHHPLHRSFSAASASSSSASSTSSSVSASSTASGTPNPTELVALLQALDTLEDAAERVRDAAADGSPGAVDRALNEIMYNHGADKVKKALNDVAGYGRWSGQTALLAALRPLSTGGSLTRHHHRVIRILLKAGADPTFPGAGGITPLHVAAKHGHAALIAALLDKYRGKQDLAAAAAIVAVSDSGDTPLSLAMALGGEVEQTVRRVLVPAGGRRWSLSPQALVDKHFAAAVGPLSPGEIFAMAAALGSTPSEGLPGGAEAASDYADRKAVYDDNTLTHLTSPWNWSASARASDMDPQAASADDLDALDAEVMLAGDPTLVYTWDQPPKGSKSSPKPFSKVLTGPSAVIFGPYGDFLRDFGSSPVTVIRDGRETRVRVADVVVGDVLNVTDRIPADGLLIEASPDLTVNEAFVIGIGGGKFSSPSAVAARTPSGYTLKGKPGTSAAMWAGSTVINGWGRMLVTAVGRHCSLMSAWTTLRAAVWSERTDVMESLLASGANPNAITLNGMHILRPICHYLTGAGLRILINGGLDVRALSISPGMPLKGSLAAKAELAVMNDTTPATFLSELACGAEPGLTIPMAIDAGALALAGDMWTIMCGTPEAAATSRKVLSAIGPSSLLMWNPPADAAGPTSSRVSVIHRAALLPDSTVLGELLKASGAAASAVAACVDGAGQTPLHWAAAGGREEAVKLLLETGGAALADQRDSLGRTPLMLAAAVEELPVVYLKEPGSAQRIVVRAGSQTCPRGILRSQEGGRAVLLAGDVDAKGLVGAVRALVAAGADVNASDGTGSTPLHVVAASLAPTALVKWPSFASASVQLSGRRPTASSSLPDLSRARVAVLMALASAGHADLSAVDSQGRRPLSAAPSWLPDVLAAHAPELSARFATSERSESPAPMPAVIAATRRGDLSSVAALLRLGEDPDAVEPGVMRRPALAVAVSLRHWDIAAVLLNAGASAGRVTADGRSPVEFVSESDDEGWATMLALLSQDSELEGSAAVRHWVSDMDAPKCMDCRETEFNRWRLQFRHHCRECGRVICGNCTRWRNVNELASRRVCRRCMAVFDAAGSSGESEIDSAGTLPPAPPPAPAPSDIPSSAPPS